MDDDDDRVDEKYITGINDEDDVLVFEIDIIFVKFKQEQDLWLEQAISASRWTPIDLLNRIHYAWCPEADSVIIEHLTALHAEATCYQSVKDIIRNISMVSIPKKLLKYVAQGFSRYNLLEVQIRILMICYFNKSLQDVLSFIDFRDCNPNSLGSRLKRQSQYILPHLKKPLLDKAIALSNVLNRRDLPAQLKLDSAQALRSEDERRNEPSDSTCCFVQAFQQLRDKDSVIYRYSANGDHIFRLKFLNESGIDEGGVFREGMTRIAEDLFSPHFNLFILCPNGVHNVFSNMDKYVPNLKHTSDLTSRMFEFIGKLIGMSLRAELCLPFELPSVIWKGLIYEETSKSDLMNIDALLVNYLDSIRNCDENGVTDQNEFLSRYNDQLSYVYVGSDGVERELVRGGGNIIVTYSNRKDYYEKVQDARLNEFNDQIEAMRRGLLEVVPTNILPLYTWQQFEVLVCGNPSFDLDVWKANTIIRDVPSKVVELFWKVVSSMTFKEQSGLVRFAWGRSRLPTKKTFPTQMELCNAGHGAVLPIAHTCFFQIELPEYETEERMRHGLLTAVNFGGGMILA